MASGLSRVASLASWLVAIVAAQGRGGGSPVAPPQPFGPTPSAAQLRWHELESCAFLHFTTNTFTDREWGEGDESESLFAPTDFDAEQIVTALERGGLRGAILTCKHHDGFCLWPTKTTKHSVASSKWRDGHGDVVKEIAEACRRHGLLFGVYLSPWDRNHAEYGRPAYVDVYRAQLRELLTNYGDIFEVWHDGANGGSGFYGGARETRSIDRRTYYDWPTTWKLVRELQPRAVIFSDVGPDVRWVGNESGHASESCWATYTPHGDAQLDAPAPGDVKYQEGESGHRDGKFWLPAECDVSIRPGWFWHAKEDESVKSPQQLAELWFQSVGRGANLLLNVPPDRRGRVHERDAAALAQFGDHVRSMLATDLARGAKVTSSNVRGGDASGPFAASHVADGDDATIWASDDGVTSAELVLDLGAEKRFDVVRLREPIALGQRIDAFAVDVWERALDGASHWREVARGTSVGPRRLLRVGAVEADRVRVRILAAAACPCLRDVSLFAEPEWPAPPR
jgi:alpha-L-fucosidase